MKRKPMNRYDVRYMQLQQEKLDAIINKKVKVTHIEKEFGVTRKKITILSSNNQTEGVQSLVDMLYEDHKITLHPTTIYRILKRNDIRYGPYHIRTHGR